LELKELQTFLVEARKYNVLPLDPRMAERMDPRNRIAGEPRRSWIYYGNSVRLPEPVSPLIFPRSHSITAELVVPKDGAEGVVACCGGYSCGWSLYLQNGKPHFRYTYFDVANSQIDGNVEVPEGKVTIKTEYAAVGPLVRAAHCGCSSTTNRPAKEKSIASYSAAEGWSRSKWAATRSLPSTLHIGTKVRFPSRVRSRNNVPVGVIPQPVGRRIDCRGFCRWLIKPAMQMTLV
jgi:hypothetical protein